MIWDEKRHGPPYQRINDAVRTTGLSAYYLRHGCRAGTIKHIKSGTTFYVFVPALLQDLENETAGSAG